MHQANKCEPNLSSGQRQDFPSVKIQKRHSSRLVGLGYTYRPIDWSHSLMLTQCYLQGRIQTFENEGRQGGGGGMSGWADLNSKWRLSIDTCTSVPTSVISFGERG